MSGPVPGTVETPESGWAKPAERITPEIFGSESAAIAGIVFLAVAVIRMVRPTPTFPLDDAFITLHSAQVLHSGFDPNFPGMHPLYGITCAPFLGLVYLLLFFLKPLAALDIACWLGVLAYTLGLHFMTRVLGLPRTTRIAVIALGLLCSFVPYQLLNGLETSWALASVIWLLALASGNREKWAWAAVAAGLAGSIRPDLMPLAFFVMLLLVIKCWRQKQYQRAILLCVIAWIPLVLTALWYYRSIGTPFPQTGVAKHYFFADPDYLSKRALSVEALGLISFAFTVGPICIAIPYLFRSWLGRVCLLFTGIFLAALFFDWPGAIVTNRFRYPIILVPVLIWAFASERKARPALLISLLYSALFAVFAVHLYADDCQSMQNAEEDIAAWCEHNVPANSTLLIHDAGYIAYRTHFRLVDMVGLKTPAAVPLNRKLTFPSAGKLLNNTISQLAEETGSRYLIIHEPFFPTLIPDLERIGRDPKLMHQNQYYSVFVLTQPTLRQ
ncbi:hypothetical protein [Terriglobus albidus]|uniref:hypothetical protein n=1 Tax=Terriglobus albidus TaxID=1592106 RepID=UPI0021E094CB|nr:hypothetical protein [Terriglobus albidus]